MSDQKLLHQNIVVKVAKIRYKSTQTSTKCWSIMTNISCQFEIYTYNTLCSRGPTKVLALSQINVPGGHLIFQSEAKNISRQHFMVINTSCKPEKVSYNIFFLVRAVIVKSLYTLRLSSGYNDLLNSDNLKVAIAQLCHDMVCNFTML